MVLFVLKIVSKATIMFFYLSKGGAMALFAPPGYVPDACNNKSTDVGHNSSIFTAKES